MENRKQVWSTIIGVALFATFGFWFWRPFEAAHQASTFRYVSHPGTITQLNLDVDEDEIRQIEYSYTYQGRRYFGNTATHYSRHALSDIEEETGPLRHGRGINVYVNPRDPSKAVLVRGMTRVMQFGLAWCVLAAIGSTAAIISVFHHQRSMSRWRRRFDQIADTDSNTLSLELIPCAFKTPRSVAIACFVVTFTLMFGMIELWRWFGRVMGEPGGFLDTLVFWHKFVFAFAISTAGATVDYFNTLHGIAEGRWNLSVDFKSGVVNIPAVRGFGKAVRVRIDEIVGLELRTLISAHESDLDRSIFRFNVICEHEDTKWHPDGTENRETQLVAYTAAQSEDHAKLRAMAEWFNDSAGLGLPIEASACDGSALAQMSEANSYKRVVKVGS